MGLFGPRVVVRTQLGYVLVTLICSVERNRHKDHLTESELEDADMTVVARNLIGGGESWDPRDPPPPAPQEETALCSATGKPTATRHHVALTTTLHTGCNEP